MSRPPSAPSGGAAPSSADRYGARGLEWCVYDNQWLLSWAIMAARGWVDFHAQLEWLAGILESHGYPVDRLAGDLEIAADVTTDAIIAEPTAVCEELLSGAAAIRARYPAPS